MAAQRSAGMREPLKWEFPGGKIEPGETPEAALAREILEELDVAIRVGRRIATAEVGSIELTVYLATIDGDREPQAREHAALGWFTKTELAVLDWATADEPILPAALELMPNT